MNDSLNAALSEAWRLFPHTFASKASRGRWKPYDYLKLISREIVDAISAGRGRIIVELPVRHGKSEFISYWTPTWFLDLFPQKRVILTSYEADFAATWGRKVRNEIETNELLSVKLRQDSHAANRFETADGGGMITAGVGGPITGRGGDLIVVDDPIKNEQEAMSELRRKRIIDWFNSTLYTRCEPNATIVVLMARWHEEDLAGYLKETHQDKWRLISLPAVAEENDILGRKPGQALCPDRYGEEDLENIRVAVGPRVWSAIYQQRPTPMEGEIWRRSAWKFYSQNPAVFDEIIQSWDMTFCDSESSDFVVGQVWGRRGPLKYLLDERRGRWSFTDTLSQFVELSKKWPTAYCKLVESKANGFAIENQLRSKITGIRLVNPQGNKVARATACEPQIESGHVHLPDPKFYPWVNEFIEEASSFPRGKHDDRVDAASQALNFLEEKNSSISYLRKLTSC